MNEEMNNSLSGTETDIQPVQNVTPQPVVTPVMVNPMPQAMEVQQAAPQSANPYDEYISNLMMVQRKNETPEPKQRSFFARFMLLVASAILFGGLAGGAFLGVKALDKKHAEKTENADSHKGNENGQQSEVMERKNSSKGNIILQTSHEITETSVSAIDVSAVASSTMPSVVAINNYMNQSSSYYFFYGYYDEGEQTPSSGSGIIIGQNDTEVLIVTNYHVVEDAKRLSVQFVDGTTADAVIKGSASSSDLAVIAVKFEDLTDDTIDAIRVARLGNSDDVKVGEIAIAVGNALGYGQSVTVGYISAKDREITVDKVTYHLIQTDAAINPGNSGGALLNKNGEVIGINSVKYTDTSVEGMGFAIPISSILDLIEELSNREEIAEEEMGYLGIERGTDITDEYSRFNIPKGLYVNSVARGSAAEKAGIMSGDIIVRVDKVIIYGMTDLQEFLSYTKAGTEVEVEIYRNINGIYESQVITVKLDTVPSGKKKR